MRILIEKGRVITGDGATDRVGNVWIDGDRIEAVDFDPAPEIADVAMRIDAAGKAVLPGMINNHAHGLSAGPLFGSGATGLPARRAVEHLDRHLMQGTTTVLNVCGLTTPDEVAATAAGHPIRLRASTGHFPAAQAAAAAVDGAGLTDKHRDMTAERAVADGCVAVGEIGSGHTLGGGGQDYLYIPQAVKEATGHEIDVAVARNLKLAVLANMYRGVKGADLATVMKDAGLDDVPVERMRELISDSVVPPIQHALTSFREATDFAARTGLPVMFHSSSVCQDELFTLAREYGGRATLVAGHSNHNTYTVEDAVAVARGLRDLGVVIDVSTLDGVITRWRNDMAHTEALAEAKLIDTVSTDYGNGHWDSPLEGVHHLSNRKYYTLAEAVALGTGNVARAYPALADGRGLLAPGRPADVVLADAVNVGRVHSVIVGGDLVVDAGWPVWTRTGR
jgi:imidazolonepropionase-like amidohydrolase